MSFPRYKHYKDTSVQWLPSVPAHWEVTRLRFLSSRISSGKTPLGGSETYVNEGVTFLRSQNVYDEGLRLDDVVFISDEVDVQMAVSRILPGDILLNITGASLGRSCIVPQGFRRANVNQHVCAIRMLDQVLAPFISWCLKSSALKVQMDVTQNGAAREGLNFQQVGALTIAIPPAVEQRAITTFLERETATIDDLVAEQRSLISLLQEKRQAIIAHVVTRGLNSGVSMKHSGVEWLGALPKWWQPIQLGVLFKETVESGNDELPVLSVSIHHGVSDKEFDEDELERKVTRSEDRSKYIRVEPGDLVYNMMRAWQGAFGTVKVEGMVSPAYVVARPRFEISTEFVEYLLRTPQAIEELRRHSHGVTDFRLRLYWDEFKTIKIGLPPLEEQRAILEFISAETAKIDALVSESETAITLLQEHRAALISAAITGKIDVRGFASVSAMPKRVAAA